MSQKESILKTSRADARRWLKKGFEPTQICMDHFLRITDKLGAKQKERLDEIQAYMCRFPEPKGKGGVFPPMPFQDMMTVLSFGSLVGMDIPDESLFTFPRKQGKTSHLAKVVLASMKFCPDTKPKAYSFATKKEQANLILKDGKSVVSNYWTKILEETAGRNGTYGDWRLFQHSLKCLLNDAEWEAMPSESKSLDGLLGNVNIFDEASRVDDSTYNVVQSSQSEATGWSHLISISTASDNVDGWFCQQMLEALNRMREGKQPDSNVLAWTPPMSPEGETKLSEAEVGDIEVWKKLCPGWGITVGESLYRKEYRRAQRNNESMASFRIRRLNEFGISERPGLLKDASQARTFSNPDKNHRVEHALRNNLCVMGIDLADKRDMSSLAIIARDSDGHYYAKVQSYICQNAFDSRVETSSERILRIFKSSNLLHIAGADRLDYDPIYLQMGIWSEEYDVAAIMADRGECGRSLLTYIDRVLPVKLHTINSSSRAVRSHLCDNFIDAMTERRLHVADNQLYRWAMNNAAVEYFRSDEGGSGGKNIVRKSQSRTGGIDPLYATIHGMYYFISPESQKRSNLTSILQEYAEKAG